MERAALAQPTPEQREELRKRLDAIERTVMGLKMPRSFADQVYVLREHIGFVRAQLQGGPASPVRPESAAAPAQP